MCIVLILFRSPFVFHRPISNRRAIYISNRVDEITIIRAIYNVNKNTPLCVYYLVFTSRMFAYYLNSLFALLKRCGLNVLFILERVTNLAPTDVIIAVRLRLWLINENCRDTANAVYNDIYRTNTKKSNNTVRTNILCKAFG